MGHSHRCKDLSTYWDQVHVRCVPCENITIKPGFELSPNCGYDDYGGRHEDVQRECLPGNFNNGLGVFCQPCRRCAPGERSTGPCGPVLDTQCERIQRPADPNNATETLESSQTDVQWVIPFSITLSITLLLVVLAVCIYMKLKGGFNRGQQTVLRFRRNPSSAGFSSLSAPPDNTPDLNDILSPDILLLPLHTVLNELDIFEELMILLDPESQGVKNTRHLASYCSFSSTWITYTYSMKESKSPLQAVLEGITCRYPEWTVGHLAKMLKHMQRNDAIAVLAKLKTQRQPVEEALEME